jgi:hypothetical protein
MLGAIVSSPAVPPDHLIADLARVQHGVVARA